MSEIRPPTAGGAGVKAKPLTPAQRKALEAIRDGKVKRHYPWGRGAPSWSFSRTLGLRQDVVTRLVDARYARVGPRRNNGLFADVEITDVGMLALERSA